MIPPVRIIIYSNLTEYKDSPEVIGVDAFIEKDDDGNFCGWNNVVIPRQWLEREKINFKGVPIQLSHPAYFLAHKIWFTRKSDEADIEQFALSGALSPQDIEDLLGYEPHGNDKPYQALKRVEKLHENGQLPALFLKAMQMIYFGQEDEPPAVPG